ncbi:hypothetical protein [Mycobacteroides abscessus]|uniref:hypothetical protein n=1 Tax=Mycobacteroides abscessus TaxID=36809 RepID=UPI0010425BFF|nr:hypothetical protein [Mycobacteroides abscessus]
MPGTGISRQKTIKATVVFTLPLSDAEYRTLVELKQTLKYGDTTGHAPVALSSIRLFPDLPIEATSCRTVAGWALLDDRKQVFGWHWIDHADPHWADADSAAQSFINDTRHRDWLLRRRGYLLARDESGQYLTALLERNEDYSDAR